MDPSEQDSEGALETFLNAINAAGEDFRILAEGPREPEDILETVDAPWSQYIKRHDPWGRAFVIWTDQSPAAIATNFRDQWSVTPSPSKGVVKRTNIYAKLVGGRHSLMPRLIYEPAGEETTAIDLELHPMGGQEGLFRTVATDGTAIPDIKCQVWDFTEN